MKKKILKNGTPVRIKPPSTMRGMKGHIDELNEFGGMNSPYPYHVVFDNPDPGMPKESWFSRKDLAVRYIQILQRLFG